jgi:sn-glycerol 3-phosphate transport system ATP-binding protein/multiple sugar transport system ATP-binding protein
MARVTVSALGKRFGETRVLEAIDLAIADGAFAVLVGPSGCGKSTLLRLLAGLEEADTGAIRFGDRDVTRLEPRDRDVAMVFQSYALYPHLTVRDNLAFGLKLRKADPAEIERRVAEAAEMLGLGPLLRSPAGSGSGSRWGAPSCAGPRSSSSTSRSRTSTPPCAPRSAWTSGSSTTSSARRASTSPTIRSRR